MQFLQLIKYYTVKIICVWWSCLSRTLINPWKRGGTTSPFYNDDINIHVEVDVSFFRVILKTSLKLKQKRKYVYQNIHIQDHNNLEYNYTLTRIVCRTMEMDRPFHIQVHICHSCILYMIMDKNYSPCTKWYKHSSIKSLYLHVLSKINNISKFEK